MPAPHRPSPARPRRPRACAPLLGLAALACAACQPERGHLPGGDFNPAVSSRDPAILVSLLVSTTTPEASRKSADALLVEVKGKTDPTRLGVLEQILYAPGHSDAMRVYALDQLAAADPARAGRALLLYLPRFDGAVLAHAAALAEQLGDPRLLDPLVRSLAAAMGGQIPDDRGGWNDRPEWAAIAKLSGKDALAACADLVAAPGPRATRVAALDLLAARTSAADCLRRLAPARAAADRWLADVCWWMETFATCPLGPNESAWIEWFRRPEQAALVARAAARHRALAAQADYRPAPRFVAALAYADEAALTMTWGDLVARLEQKLANVPHAHRPPEHPGGADDVDDTLAAHQRRLSRGDLLAIDLLLAALAQPATRAEFHRLGLADLSDTTTEHGGLLAFQNTAAPSLLITPYPPLFADNDFTYVTGDKLLTDTAAGVAQYHFHFQQVRNADRAGPGLGDLAYARRTRCNCVVITSTDTRAINVDYYTPDGAVVDLGVYQVGSP
jgi:hypothetical protein